jgi:Caspase domain
MTVLVDRRAELGDQPVVHALIVGVSAYRHLPNGAGEPAAKDFGMKQLSSTALAAFKMSRWLLEHQDRLPAPLATCRLLLSPSPAELQVEAGLAGLADPPALDNFLTAADAWRADCSTHHDNIALFYFAGHGVQRSRDDAVLLLEDFGARGGGALRNTVDTNTLFNGMSPSADRPEMARTQLFFVDACRNRPAEFSNTELMGTTPVFDIELSDRDDRRAPVFYAAVPGSLAAGIRGQQTLFNRALLACLDGAAAQPVEEDGGVRWQVTVHSLSEALDRQIKELNRQLGADQDFTVWGHLKEATICVLPEPPQVEIVLEIEPLDALPVTGVEVRDAFGKLVWRLKAPLKPHPFQRSLPAGIYQFSARIKPPRDGLADVRLPFQQVAPPSHRVKVKVSP